LKLKKKIKRSKAKWNIIISRDWENLTQISSFPHGRD